MILQPWAFSSHDILIPTKPPSLSFLSRTFIYDLAGRLENTVYGGSGHFFLVRLLILISSQKYYQYMDLQASLLPIAS